MAVAGPQGVDQCFAPDETITLHQQRQQQQTYLAPHDMGRPTISNELEPAQDFDCRCDHARSGHFRPRR